MPLVLGDSRQAACNAAPPGGYGEPGSGGGGGSRLWALNAFRPPGGYGEPGSGGGGGSRLWGLNAVKPPRGHGEPGSGGGGGKRFCGTAAETVQIVPVPMVQTGWDPGVAAEARNNAPETPKTRTKAVSFDIQVPRFSQTCRRVKYAGLNRE